MAATYCLPCSRSRKMVHDTLKICERSRSVPAGKITAPPDITAAVPAERLGTLWALSDDAWAYVWASARAS